jgi:hypothetical protein
MEFEMAYQSRVAIDRIKFAIRHTEQFGPQTDEMREASFQLLDALHRLELADRKFQERSRSVSEAQRLGTERSPEVGNGHRQQGSRGRGSVQTLADRAASKPTR